MCTATRLRFADFAAKVLSNPRFARIAEDWASETPLRAAQLRATRPRAASLAGCYISRHHRGIREVKTIAQVAVKMLMHLLGRINAEVAKRNPSCKYSARAPTFAKRNLSCEIGAAP